MAAFSSIFSIVDPFTALPMYLALTERRSDAGRRRVAQRAALTCLAVLCVFAAAGPTVFRFFGITIPAFRIAGGILLFAVALEMLHAKVSTTKTSGDEAEDAAGQEDIGIIPVGIPLLSGPGAIATVMLLSGSAHGLLDRVALFVALLLVSGITWVVLRFASSTARLLGTTGMHLIGRIMGLILAAVSVQFILDGVRDAFPKLLS